MEKNFEVVHIIEYYLKAFGYDGLFNIGSECACELGNLWPCGEGPRNDCEAGYIKKGCTCGQGCEWHIVRAKP